MANRFFSQFQYSLEKKVVNLFGQVAIGATGAPTISAANSKGITSIARNSAGKYTITLQDSYNRFLGLAVTLKLSSGAPATSSSVVPVVRSEDVGGAKTVVVEFVDNAGAAIELTNGVTLLLHVKLSNSSAI
jgi:hypothetical protein